MLGMCLGINGFVGCDCFISTRMVVRWDVVFGGMFFVWRDVLFGGECCLAVSCFVRCCFCLAGCADRLYDF